MSRTLDRFYSHVTPAKQASKRRSVYKWAKKLPQLTVDQSKHGSKCKIRPVGTGKTLQDTTEEAIVQWIVQLRNDGVPVSGRMIRDQALIYAKAMEPDVTFLACHTWLNKFLSRYALAMRMRTRQGQEKPADGLLQRDVFAKEVADVMASEGISTVYNADQTACFFEYLPRTTVAPRGAKTVWVKCGGHEKSRATAMLLGDSDGNSYAPFLVFKTAASKVPGVHKANIKSRQGFGAKNWKSIGGLEEAYNCKIYANTTAWWNSGLSVDFLEYHFGARQNMDQKVLLLWDAFSGHKTAEVTAKAEALNVLLMQVPAKYTWACQPADISWNKPLKDRLRQAWLESLKNQLTSRQVGTRFKLKAPNRAQMTKWICRAFYQLSSSTISSGFRKARLGPCFYNLAVVDIDDGNTDEPPDHDTDAIVHELEALDLVDAGRDDIAGDAVQCYLNDQAERADAIGSCSMASVSTGSDSDTDSYSDTY
jgi:hypothetical protein